ncbi:MAG: DHA2 family efflux MFS transporter permease subunit [Novosphingobium sp.]|jgi:DHA2 family multidrug resistance protein|uniref:DHA2 family efflux MFS transporter permease subunit n=1 Tax=Novosphingobium sp. TaxID=1874826 RepID=UPI00391DBBF6
MLPVDNPTLLTVGIMLASLLQILDSTIANVAIPHMQSALGATPDTITWALTSYIVATAVAMPMTGWLSDRVGSRNLFIWSVAGFILSSMLCGMSQNLTQMVLFRALQGATGAFISPLSQAAMIDTNKPSRQPQMMALWGMGIMVGPILGPFLGGWLTENANWRWVFYVNVPLGAVSLAILLAGLPSRERIRRRFDLAGFALLAICLTAIQMLLDRGNHVDWFDSAESWIYLAVAVSTGWMALVHFATSAQPLFDRGLFANSNFVVAMMISVVIGVVMFATMALLPPMLQHLFGYTVIDTGEALVPRGIGTMISMQLAGWLVRRGVDPRIMITLGFSIAAWSLWDMAGWSLAVDREAIMLAGLVQGIGMGMVFIPMNSVAFATLSPQLRTDGASLLNLCRSIGSSIGIAVTTAFAARSIQVSHADLAGHVTASASSMIDVSATERFQTAGETALRMVDAEVNRQAAMIAYVNDFWLMMWLALAAVPLALLLRRQTTVPRF